MIATVREWSDEEGWGIVSTGEVPDIFVHFGNVEMDGYKSLKPGEQLEVEVERVAVPVKGCRYGASVARPLR